MLKDYNLKKLVEPLCLWFAANARVLPWRDDPTPYHVWISEIMLQQTRVEAVKEYYNRFLKTLPDVKALAACGEDTYLKLWEGLGYYSRVRNLHTAAVQIMEEYDGRIPDEYETLLRLKGIGRYTAGAISSLAYEKPVPCVDGNVLRVLTRVSGDYSDIMKQSFRTEVEQLLKGLLEEITAASQQPSNIVDCRGKALGERINVSSRIFNQALMELGALVCVPNGEPHCGECPWQEMCVAKRDGLIAQIPVKTKKKERRIEDRTVLLIRDEDRIALHKRPGKGLLAGLYEFPNKEGHMTASQVLSMVREMGYSPIRIKELPDAVHIFSHVEWHMIGYSVLVEEAAFATEEQKARAAAEHLLFVNTEEQKKSYALPSAFAAYRPDI